MCGVVQCRVMHAEAKEKYRQKAERVRMQCNKLAARPSLRNRGSKRTSALATQASWLLVLGRPKVLARVGQVKVSRNL